MSKFRYNPGDQVRVISKFKPNTSYYMRSGDRGCVERQRTGDDVIPDRVELQGKTVTIDRITILGNYRIKEDDGAQIWTDDMFVEQTEGVKFKSLL